MAYVSGKCRYGAPALGSIAVQRPLQGMMAFEYCGAKALVKAFVARIIFRAWIVPRGVVTGQNPEGVWVSPIDRTGVWVWRFRPRDTASAIRWVISL